MRNSGRILGGTLPADPGEEKRGTDFKEIRRKILAEDFGPGPAVGPSP
jgi:hypothetical protein